MQIPEKDFYYHYKHDELKGFNHHAYEVVGLVRHSEDESLLIIHLPSYENESLAPAQYWTRPIELFFDEVIVNGKALPHFTKITDPETILKLREIRDQF